MAALSSGEINFNIDSSTDAGDSAAVHSLTSIQVGDEIYTDFIAPDSVTFDMDDFEGLDNEARLFVGSEGGSQDVALYPTDGARNNEFENVVLESAFQSDDLNSYVESSSPSPDGEQSLMASKATRLTTRHRSLWLMKASS